MSQLTSDAYAIICTDAASCDLPLVVTVENHMQHTLMSVYGNIWHTNSRDRWANGVQHAGCLEMGWQWWKHGQIRAGMSHKQLPWQQLPCVSLWVWAEAWYTPPETPSNRQESQSRCCHNHTNQKAEQTSTTSVKKGVRVIHRVHNTPTSRCKKDVITSVLPQIWNISVLTTCAHLCSGGQACFQTWAGDSAESGPGPGSASELTDLPAGVVRWA